MQYLTCMLITLCLGLISEKQVSGETRISGVYKSKSLFIQNPFDPDSKTFCISQITINDRPLSLNYRVSALKVDFENVDPFSPVVISIAHVQGCKPTIINPDAIFFHSIFSFEKVEMTDSSLVWKTIGEQPGGVFYLERYEGGIWRENDTIPAKGTFEQALYNHFPEIEEGANKFRLKYIFPDNTYLYSREIDFHFYPEPVTFKPFSVSTTLYFSRNAQYEIYDGGSNLVMSGRGNSADVSKLPRGDYVIYFNDKDPGLFRKN